MDHLLKMIINIRLQPEFCDCCPLCTWIELQMIYIYSYSPSLHAGWQSKRAVRCGWRISQWTLKNVLWNSAHVSIMILQARGLDNPPVCHSGDAFPSSYVHLLCSRLLDPWRSLPMESVQTSCHSWGHEIIAIRFGRLSSRKYDGSYSSSNFWASEATATEGETESLHW